MKLLFVGRGKAGSWIVRGEQLSAALGAQAWNCSNGPIPADMLADCDAIIIVKKTNEETLTQIRKAGKPWFYDIIDSFPQPLSSSWQRSEAINWVRNRIESLKPHAVVWPTQRMKDDCSGGVYGLVLPHHHRPGIAVNPIREKIQTVGYEGRVEYLAGWHSKLEHECARRGWRFVTNPAQLADLDIVVSFRGGQWDGYAARNWKSAVKLANAHASGTPWIGQRESGYEENASGAEYWADSLPILQTSFDWLEAQSTREQVQDRFLQAAFPVEKAAAKLKEFVEFTL